jgi:hypothetical protein
MLHPREPDWFRAAPPPQHTHTWTRADGCNLARRLGLPHGDQIDQILRAATFLPSAAPLVRAAPILRAAARLPAGILRYNVMSPAGIFRHINGSSLRDPPLLQRVRLPSLRTKDRPASVLHRQAAPPKRESFVVSISSQFFQFI